MLKKIETTEHRKKRDKRKTTIGIAIAAILVLSTIGFTLMQSYDSQETKEYNGYSFIKQGNFWQTKADNTVVATLFLPQEVENVTTKTPFISRGDFSNKVVFFIAKTDLEKQASYELSQYLPALRMQYACLPGDEDIVCKDLPEKDCEDADNVNAIVIIQDTSETINETTNITSINYSQGCLEVKGNQETLIKVVEKIIFIMFGIIS